MDSQIVKVTDFTCNGKCSGCGACCTDMLPLTKKEIDNIRRFIKDNNIQRQYHAPVCSRTVDLTCPFRDNENNKCVIYDVRPSICRTFICNKSREDILKNREYHANRCKTYSMQYEFFNDSSSINYMEEVRKELAKMVGGD